MVASSSPSTGTSPSSSALGKALAEAIAALRTRLHDPLAPIAVVVPAGPNGVLARRALSTQGPILRVWFETPDGLLRDQLPASSWATLRPEPAGWFRVTLAHIVDDLAARQLLGRFGTTLTRRGWRDPLAAALTRLERDGVTAADLDAVTAIAATAEPHVAERTTLLATLMRALDAARMNEALASNATLAQASNHAIGREAGVGASLAVGAVILGDRELSFTTFTFLKTWLASRPVVRVLCAPSSALPPAPWGLLAASAHATPIEVQTAALPPRLRALLNNLHRPGTTAAPTDASVTFARTPDDVRECVECVREVQRAIGDGVPLDRIAVVLPDSKPRGALEEALDRAGIPCTWLMGFPAKDLMAARLLRVAVDVALGAETPLRLYELLAHPALDLRGAIGPDNVRGRGRWRRMLANVVRARGLDNIIRGVEQRPVRDNLTPEDLEREQHARASFVASTRAVQQRLAAFTQPGPLGAHARAWKAFLLELGRRSESRGKLLALLEPLAVSNAGPTLTAAQARDELTSLLDKEVARGNLAERSVRVLPPMYLLGGEVDVVLMLGLTEGRFPKPAREDAVLPDELLQALSAVLGRSLPLAREREALERRRFAAALGAARQRLWLSLPQVELDSDRPLLPSSLALEALSAVIGRRARFSDLSDPQHIVIAGSRARTWPLDPDTAVGPLEHLVARLAAGTADVVTRALSALASHPTSRGLLQLHRSMEHARNDVLDAWTGLVPPQVLAAPGLDETPIALRDLVQLWSDPGTFFFKHMLRAFPPPRLTAWPSSPLDRATLENLLLDVVRTEEVPSGDVTAALAASVLGELEQQHSLGAFDAASLDQSRPMVQAIARALAKNVEQFARAAGVDGPLRVADDLPWHLADVAGRLVHVEGAVLTDVARKRGHATLQTEDRPDLVLSALALTRAGTSVETVAVLSPKEGEGKGAIAPLLGALTLGQLRDVTKAAQAGRFEVHGARTFRLAGDQPANALGEDPMDSDEDAA